MTPAHGISRALVARSLNEAIDAVAAPHVRDAVISRALADAGLHAVPERGGVVLTFAQGPLKRALTQRLGEEICDEVLAQIAPLLKHASHVGEPALRLSQRPQHQDVEATRLRTRRAPPSEEMLARAASDEADALDDGSASGVYASAMSASAIGSLPPIFLASSDDAIARRLGGSLTGRAIVHPLGGLLELVDALESHELEAPVVLVDCGNPVLQVASLVALAPDLPAGTVVLVWGPSMNDDLSLRDAPDLTATWSRLPAAMSIDALAKRCIDVLG